MVNVYFQDLLLDDEEDVKRETEEEYRGTSGLLRPPPIDPVY